MSTDLSPCSSTVHPFADLPADTRDHLVGLLGTIPGHTGVDRDVADVADWLLDDSNRDDDAGKTLKSGSKQMSRLVNRVRSDISDGAMSTKVGDVNCDGQERRELHRYECHAFLR